MENIRFCLKQILTNYPDGLSLQQLEHKYRELNNDQHIPYAELNYRSTNDLLNSIPGKCTRLRTINNRIQSNKRF